VGEWEREREIPRERGERRDEWDNTYHGQMKLRVQ
jgi:hypothetical protein